MISRVLVVEDEPDLGRDAEDDMQEIRPDELIAHGISGFEFAHAACGSKARELLKEAALAERPFHVVLLDLGLPENCGDRLVSPDVGFSVLEFAKTSGGARIVIPVSVFEDQVLKALRAGVADFVPKGSREVELKPRFLRAWKSLIEAETERMRSERIRHLLPQAQLVLATRLSSCFSDFLRDVARIDQNFRAGLAERLDIDINTDRFETLLQDANRLSEVVRQAKRSWGAATAEIRPDPSFGMMNLNAILNRCACALEPCVVASDAETWISLSDGLEVTGSASDTGAILFELLIGPLFARSGDRQIQVSVTTRRNDPWAEVVVDDNTPRLAPEDRDRINNGFPIPPDPGFGRAWGLSVVQHTAIRGGGRIEVSTSDTGNSVMYQIPLSAQELEHAAGTIGGERRA